MERREERKNKSANNAWRDKPFKGVFIHVCVIQSGGIRRTANRAIPSRAHLARTNCSYRYIASVRVVGA